MRYFRVLDPMTHAAWKAGRFTSTHFHPPDEWQETWKSIKSDCPDDYPLACRYGLYTGQARARFLTNCTARGGYDGFGWPEAVRRGSGELDGVCCWETAEQAWSYAVEGDLDGTWIAEFEGEKVCEIFEKEGGGLQARVKEEVEVLDAASFAEKYGFAFP